MSYKHKQSSQLQNDTGADALIVFKIPNVCKWTIFLIKEKTDCFSDSDLMFTHGYQVLHHIHMRQRVDLGWFAGVGVNLVETGKCIPSVNVHRTRSTNTCISANTQMKNLRVKSVSVTCCSFQDTDPLCRSGERSEWNQSHF